MTSAVDMSLEDLIKTRNIKGGRGRGGTGGPRGRSSGGRGGIRRGGAGVVTQRGGRGGVGTGGGFGQRNLQGNVNGRWSHDMFSGYGGGARMPLLQTQSISGGPTKLLIANLEFGVSDSDIHELFGEFGPMRNAAVHYDRSGRSLGTAHVVFERNSDALKALKQYNGVHLDGRPMNISIEGGVVASRPVLAPVKRLSQFPRPLMGGAQGGFGMRRGTRGTRGGFSERGSFGTSRGRGSGRSGKDGKVPTAAELDAELDAYVKQISK